MLTLPLKKRAPPLARSRRREKSYRNRHLPFSLRKRHPLQRLS
jgi:hypothetical protein